MCSGCGQKKIVVAPTSVAPMRQADTAGVISKSNNPEKKVKIRYYGGGLTSQGEGCRSCSGGGKYALATTENIAFASDDSPNGWFSQTFHIGHDYYVTEKQAEYLCSLTFRTAAGEEAHKFKEI